MEAGAAERARGQFEQCSTDTCFVFHLASVDRAACAGARWRCDQCRRLVLVDGARWVVVPRLVPGWSLVVVGPLGTVRQYTE